jgi:hypothetical protein
MGLYEPKEPILTSDWSSGFLHQLNWAKRYNGKKLVKGSLFYLFLNLVQINCIFSDIYIYTLKWIGCISYINYHMERFFCLFWLSPLMLWVRISIRARCTTLCDKVCQWLATGRWFSPGIPVFSTNETDRHDINEMLWSRFELTTSVVICTDCICSGKSNYHMITTTTDPKMFFEIVYYNLIQDDTKNYMKISIVCTALVNHDNTIYIYVWSLKEVKC